jgi:heme/copper-type cytochrome/quinol oxidase subunit 2
MIEALFMAAYWFIFIVMMLVGVGIAFSVVVWTIIGALTLRRR